MKQNIRIPPSNTISVVQINNISKTITDVRLNFKYTNNQKVTRTYSKRNYS